MKRTLFLSLTLLLLAIDALAQSGGMAPPPSAWQRYTVRNEEFSITLPTIPAMTTYKRSRDGVFGKKRTHRHLGVYADGVVYTIYTDDDDDPRGRLQHLDRTMTGPRWERSTEEILNRDGVTGKQYTSAHPLGGVVQVFATKKHFYRFEAFGVTAADPRVQHFFSSLMFGNKHQGIEVSDGPGTPFEPVDGSVQIPPENVLTGKLVDRKAVLMMKPEPSYTERARQNQVTGVVVIRAVFSANGSVVNIEVKSSLPDGLTEQAIEAAKKIKFLPAAKDGKFVPVWMQLEYNFNLY
jgi:TonB family protein